MSRIPSEHWIYPDWPAPATIHALTTTRDNGISQPPWTGLNLGDHVGDDPGHVASNRQWLTEAAGLPSEPRWLAQCHGNRILDSHECGDRPEADGCKTSTPGIVCAVLTADCLPVLICDRHGRQVAAVHAGWRGLAAGIVEHACAQMQSPAADLLVWLGPAIGPRHFEVGDPVYTAFVGNDRHSQRAFQPTREGHWLADLYQLARLRLQRIGVDRIFGGEYCTFSDSERFYSFRRDGQTGRMATLIWIDEKTPAHV